MITAYLIYDLRSLRTCTLTCYSWYIAAAPLFHRSLIYPNCLPHEKGMPWVMPLTMKHTLGLLPLVKTVWVRGTANCGDGLFPREPKPCNIIPFLPLTGVNQLRIDYLDIPGFMPWIRLSFRNFLPTLRDLALKDPKGSSRQIIYFVGHFQHLQDLKLVYSSRAVEPVDNLQFIPPFVPPLRGSLIIKRITGAGLLKDMIELFRGIRFHHMDLFDVDGMRLLLDACAGTLESVVLDPRDRYGELLSSEGTQVVTDYFRLCIPPRLRSITTQVSSGTWSPGVIYPQC